jgi:ubiquinone/menaquinone biosynthesis C-methylase UbiE
MSDPQPFTDSYLLGHADRELDRLVLQAEFLRPLTELLLARAGIGPGMRVLDVGTGMGDVAFLIAQRVGPTGAVVGIDRAAAALSRARRRAEAAGLANVAFVESALEDYAPAAPFDAAVGRAFLIHQPDPVAAVKQVAAHVRSGGAVAFQDTYFPEKLTCWPRMPLLCQTWQWLWLTFVRAGFDPDRPLKLLLILREAGMVGAEGMMEGQIFYGADTRVYAWMAESARTFLPLAERFGIATAAEVDIDTLEDRIRAEMVAAGGVMANALVAGVWARTP